MLTETQIFTIGHSTHPIERFLTLLVSHDVKTIVDVRSVPYSKYTPVFNRESLRVILEKQGIRYLFFGDTLGGHSNDGNDYLDGQVAYARLKERARFSGDIDRIIEESSVGLVAVMCSEKDPLNSHRFLLISQKLCRRGIDVRHILEDGTTRQHSEELLLLLQKYDLDKEDLFRSLEERLSQALLLQEQKVAFKSNEITS